MPGELIPGRLVIGARAAWGATLLLAPARVLRHCGDPPGLLPEVVARALGLRHVTQAALQRRHRSPAATSVFRAVDLSHGATMALLAAERPEYRRPALTSFGIALALALVD